MSKKSHKTEQIFDIPDISTFKGISQPAIFLKFYDKEKNILVTEVMAQTTTYRDNLDRKDGTAETKGNGSIYRDNFGRKQGSSTTRK